MSIAIDQTRLRTIIDSILAGDTLTRSDALMILQIAQVAAGSDHTEEPVEHAILQAIAQHINAMVGFHGGEVSALEPIDDYDARLRWFRSLAAGLHSQAAREVAFAMAFLVSVSDLELRASEHEGLEELQLALGVDHRRATELVIELTETVAAATEGAGTSGDGARIRGSSHAR